MAGEVLFFLERGNALHMCSSFREAVAVNTCA